MRTKTIYDQRYVNVIDKLRSIRRQLGLTQLQVAEKLGWSRTTVSTVEIRERRLDLLEAHQLCCLYRLSLSDLEAVLQQKGGDGGTESP